MTEEKRDYRQDVTNDIIRLLEEGTAPWQRPWKAGEAGRLPYNPTTNKPYRGGNVLSLMMADMRKGYGDPRWMTYRQAAEKEWQVRKGEKASAVEFWDIYPDKNDATERRFVHKVYSVFNGQQIDGIPEIEIIERPPFEVIAAGEKIIADSGADFRHGGNRAFYNRGSDHVQMPPKESFIDAPAYYSTAAHELTHWTGNEKRLNRDTLTKSRGFNPEDEHYAREELIAELGSMMIAAETGLPHDPSQHAAYVASWLKALKNDKNEIFKAASAASSATDYVLGKNRAVEEAIEAIGPHTQRILESRQAVRAR